MATIRNLEKNFMLITNPLFPNLNNSKLRKFQVSGNLCFTLAVLISPFKKLISHQWLRF